MHSTTLLSQYPIISDQMDKRELEVLLSALEQQLISSPTGNIVEFGCYTGTTSLFIRRLLDRYDSEAEFHVYDSFEGLPEKTANDKSPAGEQFKAGELTATKKDFLKNFRKANLKPPVVHKSWFSDVVEEEVPDRIAFAFLDGDYYESILTPLKLIAPKLLPGATIVVDDYVSEALPGAQRAVDIWLRAHKALLRTQHSLAIITLDTE